MCKQHFLRPIFYEYLTHFITSSHIFAPIRRRLASLFLKDTIEISTRRTGASIVRSYFYVYIFSLSFVSFFTAKVQLLFDKAVVWFFFLYFFFKWSQLYMIFFFNHKSKSLSYTTKASPCWVMKSFSMRHLQKVQGFIRAYLHHRC